MREETIILFTGIIALVIVTVVTLCLGCTDTNCYIVASSVGALVYLITKRDVITQKKGGFPNGWFKSIIRNSGRGSSSPAKCLGDQENK